MAYSYKNYLGDGSTKVFTVSFPFLSPNYVHAYVDGIEVGYTWNSATTVLLNGDPPPVGAAITIRRQTPINQRFVDFNNISMLNADNLNKSAEYNLQITQEAIEYVAAAMIKDSLDDKFDALNKVIKNLAAPVNPNDAVNKAYVDVAYIAVNAAGQAQIDAVNLAGTTQVTNVATMGDQKIADAQTQANASAASASASNTSATNAANSATAAANSATQAANSATASQNSANDSANSATQSRNAANDSFLNTLIFGG